MKDLKKLGTIIGLLMLILSYRIADAEQPLAQQTFNILEQHCLDCHGEFGAYADALVIQHKRLIETQAVVPGNPDASELYVRLLRDTTGGERMPLGQSPLNPEAIATIRDWIRAGAPDWNALPQPHRRFITTDAMLEAIHTHVASLTTFDRTFARYFTLTHLYNAGATNDNLRAYRNALSKLINSLSWGPRVRNPQPINSEETIFYIDLRHYEWDRENNPWYRIEQAYPYGIQLNSATYTTLCQKTKCELPFVRADWFIATASLPPLYYDILDLPKTDRELEAQLGVNVAANIKNAPGVRVWRAGFNESGVSNNNRIVERHEYRYGMYWKTYDFAGNVGQQNIFAYPLDFTHDGGEIIFNLPNGLQAYYLSTASGDRLDAAPIKIVSNAGARDPVVHNGLSCMGCHTEGMKAFEDQVRPAIEQVRNPPYNREQVLRLYAKRSEMASLVRVDTERYKQAIETAGGVFGGSEPIQQLVKQFEGPIDASHAAAEVGLEKSDFIEKIRGNDTLQKAGLTVLAVPKGSMKRDAWTSQFSTVVSALHLGKQSGLLSLPITTGPKIEPPQLPINPYTDMVLIPAGNFQMGSSDGNPDEKPVHTVYVDAFYMDIYEVTNAQYKKFVDANPQWRKSRISKSYHDGDYLKHWNGNSYPSGKGNHPVVYVSWYSAMAYAQWLGKRLPTEAEWEKAARGGLVGLKYPWGNVIDFNKANHGGHVGDTTAVGTYPSNKYGLYDMTGNVWEWCLDAYNWGFYKNSPRRNPIAGKDVANVINHFTNVKTSRVLRGGSRLNSPKLLRAAERSGVTPLLTTKATGFRCVRVVTP